MIGLLNVCGCSLDEDKIEVIDLTKESDTTEVIDLTKEDEEMELSVNK